MSERRLPNLIMERRWGGDVPIAERVLHFLGAHPSFADALLGDLAEERARRANELGALSARLWWSREALRAVPHLLLNALRHGGALGRARAMAALMVVAAVPTLATLALLRDPPPARLVVDGQGGGEEGIVLNSRHPIQLAMRALDEKGRTLPKAEVQYQWVGGLEVPVTSNGIVTCTGRGDAEVRASAGAVSTTLLIRCRPVKQLYTDMWLQLVAGEARHPIGLWAVGPDSGVVTLLAGDIHVGDTAIAALSGRGIRPRAPGHTVIITRIGDAEAITGVTVYEPVQTLDGLRPDQKFVVAPVRVGRDETIRWPLPSGQFWMVYLRHSSRDAMPRIATQGPVMCMPDFVAGVDFVHCLVRGDGASVTITHPGTTDSAIAGRLALGRQEDR